MSQIYEPVTECLIKFKYLTWTPDNRGKQYYEDLFIRVPDLARYFKRFPAAGKLVGYGKGVPGAVFAIEASIIFEWTDQSGFTRKEFANARDFARFLDEHPQLAKKVDYEKKSAG
jgi:hypothetical protein